MNINVEESKIISKSHFICVFLKKFTIVKTYSQDKNDKNSYVIAA